MRAEILEEIGLTKSEIRVYLSLIELGSSSTGKIVDKAGVASSKIYEILDRLVQKGLVSTIVKSGVKYFESAPPSRIIDYFQEKEKDLKSKESELRALLPELELKRSLAGIGSETQVFKGMKGAGTAFDDILKTMKKGEEYCLLGISAFTPQFERFVVNFHKKRSKQGIRCRMIVNEVAKETGEKLSSLKHTQIKYVQKELFTPVVFIVYKDKTLISIGLDEVFIQIKSKNLSDGLRAYFDYLWNQRVRTYQGIEQIRSLIRQSLDFGDYEVIAEGMKIVDVLGEEFFVWWQDEKRKRDIRSRGIMGEKYRNLPTVTKSATQFKFIPGFENPGLTFIFKDKVANVMLSNNPIAFLIENKEVADSQRNYFDLLWNQEVGVSKGTEGAQRAWDRMLDELNPGEEYYAMGVAWRGQKEKVFDWYIDFHKRRLKKGVKAKFLFVSGTEDTVEKNKNLYKVLSEVKFLPKGIYEGMQINLYHDKVLMFIWREEEPVVFSIDDEKAFHTFKTYFDSLWKTAKS
ncbi:MAG: hypothetical protein KKE20_05485 [Nanoarchaeota archaeon]|nr:hypothetical protein [Nanoarchaeota archaeon]